MSYIGNGMCMNPDCALYPKRRKKNKGHAHKVLSPKYMENATSNASAPKTRTTKEKQKKTPGMVGGEDGEFGGWSWRLLIVVLCAAASAATAAGVRERLEKQKQSKGKS